MTITVQEYLTYRSEFDYPDAPDWMASLFKEAGPEIWAYAEYTDWAIDDSTAMRMAPRKLGRAIVQFTVRQAIRAAFGARGYWLLGWPESLLPIDVKREARRLWKRVIPITDTIIAAAHAERIWEQAANKEARDEQGRAGDSTGAGVPDGRHFDARGADAPGRMEGAAAMTKELHPVALRVLEAIAAGWRERGSPPPIRYIAERCGFRSMATTQYWLVKLVYDGLADVGEDGVRSVWLTAKGLKFLQEQEGD